MTTEATNAAPRSEAFNVAARVSDIARDINQSGYEAGKAAGRAEGFAALAKFAAEVKHVWRLSMAQNCPLSADAAEALIQVIKEATP